MDSFHLDTLLAFITFWGGSRIVKNPTKSNIVRMNLGLIALVFFVLLRPPVATPAVWAAVIADVLFILVLTRTRDRSALLTAGQGKN
ncbi:MAG: hypothetical protein NTY98_04435 [Verrucomicrobia bacterium]|nr:hypothetical protein [Verrucomicrobiota bacterium]